MLPNTLQTLAPCTALLLMQVLTAPSLAADGSEEPCGGPLPGAARFDAKLSERLAAKWTARDPKYQPRTRHLCSDGSPKYTNRLFLEASPYLLQHAHNPVNWYPWGDEAFELAKKLNRPVLLSVGYSTCHWCHVMEEESFEDVEIATLLNEHYIAVKVDREERPDVDAIYMSAVQALTGGGGWPMTVWLTPDRKPFFGGTYFPARDGDRGARHGFLTLVKGLGQAYHEQADQVAESSQKLAAVIGQILSPGEGGTLPGARILHQAARFYKSRFDAEHGGLEGAPKFPSSYPVRLLLRYHRRTGDRETLNQAIHTLKQMAAGGIHDQVGGGFHRYATDERWLVPHFEKMLYDNALLAIAYLEAYQATKDAEFKHITEKTLRYVERDMSSPEGGFYSATDADSPAPGGHREEGWFFTWTPAEVDRVLDPDKAKLVKAYYQITEEGNFEGRNILHTPVPLAEAAKPLKLPEEEARRSIEASLEQLYQARLKRPPPLRDEKVLTAWNGLMISAYARAGLIFKESRYLETARRAADFVFKNLYDKGRLYRSYKDGEARLNGYLDDYAFLTAALLDLYEATQDLNWLRRAIALDETLENFFEDKRAGGFFMTSSDHDKLLAREKPAYDGAEPSGNSVALLNLLRLQEFTTEDRYRKRAEKALGAFAGRLESNPLSLTEMLLGFDFYLDKPKEIIIVTPEGKKPASDTLMAEFRKVFIPNRILTVLEEGEELERHAALIPLANAKRALKGRPTAYVCEQGICELPTGDPPTFSKQIGIVEKLEGSR